MSTHMSTHVYTHVYTQVRTAEHLNYSDAEVGGRARGDGLGWHQDSGYKVMAYIVMAYIVVAVRGVMASAGTKILVSQKVPFVD